MYRREVKKLHDTKSGQAAGTTRELKRQYFMLMSFVKKTVMVPQPTLSNVRAAEGSVFGILKMIVLQQMFQLMIKTMMNLVTGFTMNANQRKIYGQKER